MILVNATNQKFNLPFLKQDQAMRTIHLHISNSESFRYLSLKWLSLNWAWNVLHCVVLLDANANQSVYVILAMLYARLTCIFKGDSQLLQGPCTLLSTTSWETYISGMPAKDKRETKLGIRARCEDQGDTRRSDALTARTGIHTSYTELSSFHRLVCKIMCDLV